MSDDSPEIKTHKSSRIIKGFVNEYNESKYATIADRVRKKIEERLRKDARQPYEHHLLAEVSSRGKFRESLLTKLQDKNHEETFESKDDISRRIVDLAGVRISLIIPIQDQRYKARALLQDMWGSRLIHKDRTEKTLQRNEAISSLDLREPQDRSSRGTRREGDVSAEGNNKVEHKRIFIGYDAEHYILKVEKDDVGRGVDILESDRVEIQVTTAMAHALAEAEHDIVYKQRAYGRVSPQEVRILDTVHAQIQVTYKSYAAFWEIFNNRVYRCFEHAADLQICLRNLDVLKDTRNFGQLEPTFNARHLQFLFQFLTLYELQRPKLVRIELQGLGFPEDAERHVLSRVNKYTSLIKLRARDKFYKQNLLSWELQVLLALVDKVLQRPTNKRKRNIEESKHKTADGPRKRRSTRSGQSEVDVPSLRSKQAFSCNETSHEVLRARVKQIFNTMLLLQTLFTTIGVNAVMSAEFQSLSNAIYRVKVFENVRTFVQYRFWAELLDENLDLEQRKCLPEIRDFVIPTWNFFYQRSQQPRSLCGFIFGLAYKGYEDSSGKDECVLKLYTISQVMETELPPCWRIRA